MDVPSIREPSLVNSLSQTKLLKKNVVTKLHYVDELQVMAEKNCVKKRSELSKAENIHFYFCRPFNNGGTAVYVTYLEQVKCFVSFT